ncbi:alpha-amylase [Sphaerosporella brunnea]|uniref:alpha-amylase n=1 Tax=Sphaerosporella brunnea TaxID=1250544 RepID=A0A5J5EHS3_9PEZI|nr:alpha-amylase [Sphaerosporella brunnea]
MCRTLLHCWGCILLLILLPAIQAATPEQWRSRSIYQLVTDRFALANGSTTHPCDTGARRYCGGSYRGITNELDYIQGMGFNAIWISPVVKNIDGFTGWGEAYHGYWAEDLNRLNPHFGSAEELRELSDALHRRGMYLMVDVVPNHFAHAGPVAALDYSGFGEPFATEDAFHEHCWITDWSDQRIVEECWLGDEKVALVDVDTALPWVQTTMNKWVKELIETYQIDGIRLDTARHMGRPFLSSFAAAAGVFTLGEVWHRDPGYTCSYQEQLSGLLNFPLYEVLARTFLTPAADMRDLAFMIDIMNAFCIDITLFGTFSENHDNPRFPSFTSDSSLIANVLTLTIIADGIPVIYSGQEHQFSASEDPHNREAIWLSGFSRSTRWYTLISKLNQLRNFMPASYFLEKSRVIYASPSTIALKKGNMVSILTNSGEASRDRTVILRRTGWTRGTWAVDVLTGYLVKVGFFGELRVRVVAGKPRVLFPLAELEGSGICKDAQIPVLGGWMQWGGEVLDMVKNGCDAVFGTEAVRLVQIGKGL